MTFHENVWIKNKMVMQHECSSHRFKIRGVRDNQNLCIVLDALPERAPDSGDSTAEAAGPNETEERNCWLLAGWLAGWLSGWVSSWGRG